VPHPDAAALSSLQTDLEQLIDRLVGIADARRDDPDDPLTGHLDELERGLVAAVRRLERTIRSL
jgi:hypothetical protein